MWIGAPPDLIRYLKNEFPNHDFISLPGYKIRYSGWIPLWLMILLQVPFIWRTIKKEKRLIEQIVNQYAFDIIISDNRYGLYTNKAETVFITHQLNIKSTIFNTLANKLQRAYIKKFNRCWVPDFSDKTISLAGELSEPVPELNTLHYIGALSRFENESVPNANKTIDYLVLLSGPEPQRTLLEKKLIHQAELLSAKRIVFVRGTQKGKFKSDQIKHYNLLNYQELKSIIANSRQVICRPGYSSIMDFFFTKTPCVFVPTPGQSEQEYLAEYINVRFGVPVVKQSELDSVNPFEITGKAIQA